MNVCGTFCIVIICSVLTSPTSATLSNSTNILHQVLLDGYNTDIRPCLDCSSPLNISVTFHLTALMKMDEIEGELHSVGYLKVVWEDERLRWNQVLNGVGSFMLSPGRIWMPPIIIANPSREISRLNSDITPVRILYNSTVVWYTGDVFHTKCSYDISRYPFDKQWCWIMFTLWSYMGNEIKLYAADDSVNSAFYQEHGQWHLESSSARDYIRNDMSFVQFGISFSRRSTYFVVNIILPVFVLSFLNCLAFVIPAESGERVSYTVTMLLSFAVFLTLISDNVPKTSAPISLLCYYLIALFNESILIMIGVMFNLRLFHRDSSTKMSSAYTFIYKMAKCCKTKKRNAYKSHISTITSTQNEIDGRKNGSAIEESLTEVSWQDVAGVFDNIGLIVSLILFTSITIAFIIL